MLVDTLRVVHVITAILMAWPFYALVAVNQRARLGPPLGDRADAYMENIIKNRTVPCYVFQATALISGLALVTLRGEGLAVLVSNAVLGVKFLLLVFIAALLTYVRTALQPRIDALFESAKGAPVSAETARAITPLRLRRRRLAAICLFCVLVAAMLGLQAWAAFPWVLTAALVVAIALFTWRAYGSVTPYGWA